MSDTRFQRRIEDFVCEHCGASVQGNGYTNHCPVCLWSKHVDDFPGDRASVCLGLMRPIAVTVKGDGYVILHRCERCGYEKPNKMAKEDDMAEVIRLSVAKILSA